MLFAIYADELIFCSDNQTSEETAARENTWIEIANFLDEPLLIKNGTVQKKWTLYNSFFVAMTVVSTIGKPTLHKHSNPLFSNCLNVIMKSIQHFAWLFDVTTINGMHG